MGNSVIFLGTGGDSIVLGKQIRSGGGIVLQLEGNQFILDPGAGCITRCKSADVQLRETIAVLLSHDHTNHSSDDNAVLEAMSVSGLDRIGVLVGSKKAIHGDGSEFPTIKKRCHNFVERVLELEAGTRIGLNNINIYTTKAKHFDTDSMGFIFEGNRYKVGYTADTEYDEEIADQYKDCSMIIFNCKLPKGEKEPGQLSTDDVIKFLKKIKPTIAIITHFGIKMMQANPMNEAREIQRETGVDIIAATDGLSINPSSYVSKTKQVSLQEFKQE